MNVCIALQLDHHVCFTSEKASLSVVSVVYFYLILVKGLWLCLWELWHSVINTTQHMCCERSDITPTIIVRVLWLVLCMCRDWSFNTGCRTTGAEDICSHFVLNREWQFLESLCHFKRVRKDLLGFLSCISIIPCLGRHLIMA